MKNPKYREIIAEVCRHQHLSADEICDIICKNYGKIGRATVYRNIEKMTEDGILRKIPGIDSKSYYECKLCTHAHLVDEDGNFHDFPLENVHISHLPDGYEMTEICIFIKQK